MSLEMIFLGSAALGGTIIVCQVLAALLGFGAELDVETADTDTTADTGAASVDGHGSWFFGVLTIRALATGLAFFGLGGLSGLSLDLEPAAATALGLFGATVAVIVVAKLMEGFKRLHADGTVRLSHAVGQTGTVYLRIPGQNAGPGKVTLTLQNRTVECEAYTHQAEIATGQPVRVVAVRGPNCVQVEPLLASLSTRGQA